MHNLALYTVKIKIQHTTDPEHVWTTDTNKVNKHTNTNKTPYTDYYDSEASMDQDFQNIVVIVIVYKWGGSSEGSKKIYIHCFQMALCSNIKHVLSLKNSELIIIIIISIVIHSEQNLPTHIKSLW